MLPDALSEQDGVPTAAFGDWRTAEAVRVLDQERFDHFIPNYLVPLLKPEWTVCSVGCGTGLDVEMLRIRGFDAVGLDPGRRMHFFDERQAEMQRYLRAGSAEDLPFGDRRFDCVYALEVIEHVGCEGFGWKLLADAAESRRAFLEACLRMVADGGCLLLTSSNRACPFDPGHGHIYAPLTAWIYERLKIRAALPWHRLNFLWSLSDVRRIAEQTKFAGMLTVEPVSISNYPKACSSKRYGAKWLRRYLRLVSWRPLLASAVCPILVVKITKSALQNTSIPHECGLSALNSNIQAPQIRP